MKLTLQPGKPRCSEGQAGLAGRTNIHNGRIPLLLDQNLTCLGHWLFRSCWSHLSWILVSPNKPKITSSSEAVGMPQIPGTIGCPNLSGVRGVSFGPLSCPGSPSGGGGGAAEGGKRAPLR